MRKTGVNKVKPTLYSRVDGLSPCRFGLARYPTRCTIYYSVADNSAFHEEMLGVQRFPLKTRLLENTMQASSSVSSQKAQGTGNGAQKTSVAKDINYMSDLHHHMDVDGESDVEMITTDSNTKGKGREFGETDEQ